MYKLEQMSIREFSFNHLPIASYDLRDNKSLMLHPPRTVPSSDQSFANGMRVHLSLVF